MGMAELAKNLFRKTEDGRRVVWSLVHRRWYVVPDERARRVARAFPFLIGGWMIGLVAWVGVFSPPLWFAVLVGLVLGIAYDLLVTRGLEPLPKRPENLIRVSWGERMRVSATVFGAPLLWFLFAVSAGMSAIGLWAGLSDGDPMLWASFFLFGASASWFGWMLWLLHAGSA